MYFFIHLLKICDFDKTSRDFNFIYNSYSVAYIGGCTLITSCHVFNSRPGHINFYFRSGYAGAYVEEKF